MNVSNIYEFLSTYVVSLIHSGSSARISTFQEVNQAETDLGGSDTGGKARVRRWTVLF